jgi:hypothetical protein
MDWPARLETMHEVDIETRAAEGGGVHLTTIWLVVDAGQVYVRSLRGGAGRWYRELIANPDAVLHAEGESVPVRAVAAPDAASVERATSGFRRKYADSRSLESMVRDEILDTTVRLEPR